MNKSKKYEAAKCCSFNLDNGYYYTTTVIYQKNPIQYISAYNGQIESNIPSERSVEAARKLLNGTRICSEDVVWQSEFPQGEIVAVFETSYSTTYFCMY